MQGHRWSLATCRPTGGGSRRKLAARENRCCWWVGAAVLLTQGVAVLLTQGVAGLLVGVAVLLCGLFFFGRDGKMASYAAMVLACAACQCAVSMRRA